MQIQPCIYKAKIKAFAILLNRGKKRQRKLEMTGILKYSSGKFTKYYPHHIRFYYLKFW